MKQTEMTSRIGLGFVCEGKVDLVAVEAVFTCTTIEQLLQVGCAHSIYLH